jgi:2'-5' RNA ligase
MNQRLFLAINLPQQIKEQLFDLVLKLQKTNKNKPIKWVEKDNFHLTLHFLGDIPEEKIQEITQALKPIVADFKTLNFQLLNSISAFPNLKDPKVIFLEMKELNDGQTVKLQKQIGEALKDLGFEIDPRPFRLHLTLGRVKFKTSIQIPDFQPSLAETNSGWRRPMPITNFQINSLDLMESNLTPSGPIYKIIKQYPLNQ